MDLQSNDPTRVVRSQDIVLPHGFAERLSLDTLMRHVELLVRPYRLQMRETSNGVGMIGEEMAVGLAAKMLEQVREALATTARLEQQELDGIVVSALQRALKFDLAFRLAGVPHPLRPMSLSQVAFMNAMLHGRHDLIFGVGPTGTGKTHLAIAAGLSLLAEGRVRQMVITRPHVLWEGEVMTAPLRAEITNEGQFAPIRDELHALIGTDATKRLFDEGKIEITPLGWLRGRTFNECFIIVDEAQNLVSKHMRMVVTRLGAGSRMVVTGDPSQVDLLNARDSGLAHALRLLDGVEGVAIARFEAKDVVRHPMVERIVRAYEADQGQ